MGLKGNSRTCLVCGEKIPLLRHLSITLFISAECPSCHSCMTYKKSILIFEFFMYVLILSLSLLAFALNSILGYFGLVLGIIFSLLLRLKAEYQIDSAHKHRLPK